MRELANWKLKFTKDVKLDQDEIDTQLKQKEPLDVITHYWGSLIKLNSTYLESADVVYGQQGWRTLFAGIPTIACLTLASAIFISEIIKISSHSVRQDLQTYYANFGAVLFLLVCASLFALMVKGEMFKLTHMPVRLNRKTRMIHVFRYDGSVLTVPWDEAFFNVGNGRYKGPFQEKYIAGHKMQDLKHWVDETFVLGGHFGDLEATRSLWEFFRRYMEEGPESALKGIKEVICLPLDRGKEPFSTGMAVIHFHMDSPPSFLAMILIPVRVLQACCRWLAFRTCKLPEWPEGIEETCVIEPDDPWVRDVTTNPPHARFGY